MTYHLFSFASTEASVIPAGNLPAFIDSYKHEFQTGVLEVDFQNQPAYHLLFARGELVNVYRCGDSVERQSPDEWFDLLSTLSDTAHLRALALTPQAVRLVKILLEQNDVPFESLPAGQGLEEQFRQWQQSPAPQLAHLRWPNAEALALLPGEGNPPHYTLFISENQILHSAGGMMALYGWKEPCQSARLFSSSAHTPAWDEYLLHSSFGRMAGRMLERVVELTGPTPAQNIAREINFAAAAHGWNITFNGSNVTDQAIFSSPQEAADVYSRLLEILFRHMENALGENLLGVLMRETLLHLPGPCRYVLQEYLLITPV